MKLPDDFQPPEGVKVYTAESVISWIHDNTICIYAIPDIVHTVDEAKHQINLFKKIIGDKKVNFIIDIRKSPPLPIETRNYYGTPEATHNIKRTAVITNSRFTNVIANFYIATFNKAIKVKTFTSIQKAKSWLQKNND